MLHIFKLQLVFGLLFVWVDLFALLRCGVGASFFLWPFRQLLGFGCVCKVSILCRSPLIILAVALQIFLPCSLELFPHSGHLDHIGHFMFMHCFVLGAFCRHLAACTIALPWCITCGWCFFFFSASNMWLVLPTRNHTLLT